MIFEESKPGVADGQSTFSVANGDDTATLKAESNGTSVTAPLKPKEGLDGAPSAEGMNGPPNGPSRLLGRVVFCLLIVAVAVAGVFCGLLLVYSTDLPQVTELENYRPSSITDLYDMQGRVIGSFALQRRVIANYDDFPKVLRDAVISIEDKDFDKHVGVSFWRAFGAAYKDMVSGSRAQGASTLTMQLARNLFLSADKSWSRKAQEIMLSLQIERRFTKPQIFTMYANQIYLGHGVYGFEAGAEFYFNKKAKDLTLEEAAVLAGLPKAPNAYSPVNSPERALKRRNLVINSMLEDGKITQEQANRAKALPIKLDLGGSPNSLAPYFVEEIRQYLEKKYGSDQVHQGGLKVYTSLDMDLQAAANRALLDGLAAYERRHGWHGMLPNVIAAGEDIATYSHADWVEPIEAGKYVHALVTAVAPAAATVKLGRYTAQITPAEMAWTGRKSPAEIFAVGDIVYVKVLSLGPGNAVQIGQSGRGTAPSPHGPSAHDPSAHDPSPHEPSLHEPSPHEPSPHDLSSHGPTPQSPTPQAQLSTETLTEDDVAQVSLEQDSGTQGALIAIDNATGDIKAMIGGRDFNDSKFNRATQALRQVGSSFKPYVYTAAVDQGASPDDVILDAPTTFATPSGAYTPHNYDGKFEGNITLRRAIAQSRNIPALKVAQQVGIKKVIEYTRRFGITSDIPAYLPIALGAADMTVIEHTSAFTAFPNDGVRVAPRYIRKVTDWEGRTLEETFPDVSDVVSPKTARVMTSLLQGVVEHGTAYAATRLKHPLAGKTGTTNDFSDAWFVGFSPSITCGVWVGFDEKSRSLGNKETGAMAALPIWIDFMKVAIQGKDQEQFPAPPAETPAVAASRPKLDKPDVAPGDGEAH